MTISFLWLAHSCGWLILVVGSLLSLAHCCRWLIVVVGSLLSLAHCCRWLIVVVGSLLSLRAKRSNLAPVAHGAQSSDVFVYSPNTDSLYTYLQRRFIDESSES